MNIRIVIFGALLIVVSLILAAVQDLHVYNIYGDVSNKWYFYGVIAAMLIIGIIVAVWGLVKKSEKTTLKNA